MLELNKTYNLLNIKVKNTNKEMYLNTTKADKFTFTETSAFIAPFTLHIRVEDNVKTTSTITTRILGIRQAFQTLACIWCHEKAIMMSEECRLMHAIHSSEAKWYIRILVQNAAATNVTFRLGFNKRGWAHPLFDSTSSMLSNWWKFSNPKEKDILNPILTNPNKLFFLHLHMTQWITM